MKNHNDRSAGSVKTVEVWVSAIVLLCLVAGGVSAQIVRPGVPRSVADRMPARTDPGLSLRELGPSELPTVRLVLLSPALDFGRVLPGSKPSAVLEATAEGCDAFRLGLQLPPGRESLVLTRTEPDGGEVSIPTTWRLRWNAGSGWTEWHEPILGAGSDGSELALWWEVCDPGRVVYQLEFRCELETAPLQRAGQYNASLRFLAVPGGVGEAMTRQSSRPGALNDGATAQPSDRTGIQWGTRRPVVRDRWLNHRREATPVPLGSTTRWQRRSAGGVHTWTRRSEMP